jgi:subtilisin family serine protease
MKARLMAMILAVSALFAPLSAAARVPVSVPSDPEYRQDRVIVRLEGRETPMTVRTSGQEVEDVIETLEGNPAVAVVEPDYLFKATAIPNDPQYAKQWYAEKIRLPEAWNFAKGSSIATVAVLDSGVDLTHPDLKDRIWRNADETEFDGIDDDRNGFVDDVRGWDFIEGDKDPYPSLEGSVEGANHGTIVAGVIGAAGSNGEGIAGVNWTVNIMPVRVLDSDGNGSTSSVEAGIRYAIRNGASVINLSFVGDNDSAILRQAIETAYLAGIVVVAAAGNEGGAQGDLNLKPRYPVCTRPASGANIVIGVAATDREDRLATFSNYGSNCVDLAAPGVDFTVTQVYRPTVDGFKQAYGGGWAGSSVAAPVVAGLAALVKSMLPHARADEIRTILMTTVVPINDKNPGKEGALGAGRVSALQAVEVSQLKALGISPFLPTVTPVPPAPVPAGAPAWFSAANRRAGLQDIRLFDEAAKKQTLAFASTTDRAAIFGSSATADVDGDGKDEIIVGAGRGAKPLVKVFSRDGLFISQFYAFAEAFRGGVSVTGADLNGDGKDEIVVGAGPGGGPHVRAFNTTGREVGSFFAFSQSFRGGVTVAGGDVDGDGKDEIVVGAGAGGRSEVVTFTAGGAALGRFNAFGRTSFAAVSVAVGDFDRDGKAEIVAVSGSSIVRYAADGTRRAGWTITGLTLDDVAYVAPNGHEARLAVAGRNARGSRLRLYDAAGKLLEDSALSGVSSAYPLEITAVR